MKDFENDLIYYPNPDPIEEPRFILNSVEELEKSTKYSVICNGTERVVYHTDSWRFTCRFPVFHLQTPGVLDARLYPLLHSQ